MSNDWPAGKFNASDWLDPGERQASSEPIDTKNIRKHANDVRRLSQLLAPNTRVPVVERIAQDLSRRRRSRWSRATSLTRRPSGIHH
ncbi:MAG: hypothetical protein ACK52I_23080 [Pseudomonadota bacterium]